MTIVEFMIAVSFVLWMNYASYQERRSGLNSRGITTLRR